MEGSILHNSPPLVNTLLFKFLHSKIKIIILRLVGKISSRGPNHLLGIFLYSMSTTLTYRIYFRPRGANINFAHLIRPWLVRALKVIAGNLHMIALCIWSYPKNVTNYYTTCCVKHVVYMQGLCVCVIEKSFVTVNLSITT